MSSNGKPGHRPRLACEIADDRVLAGRLSEDSNVVEACSSRELPAGTLVPDLTESNVRQRDQLLNTLRDTLESVSGRSRDVIAIVPDAAVRVVLLDFETLPSRAQEAESVVRFRLKKSLPYDVEKAKVSYHAQPAADGGVKVVAAVILSTVLEDYESVFRESGYSPGFVLPSMLAALGGVEADHPTLAVKVDARTTSIAIMDKNQVLLFRTLENTRGLGISGEQVAEEVYPSVVFFQDTYHLNINQILVAGIPESSGATEALRSQTGAEVRELVTASQLGSALGGNVPRWRLGGVVGALAS